MKLSAALNAFYVTPLNCATLVTHNADSVVPGENLEISIYTEDHGEITQHFRDQDIDWSPEIEPGCFTVLTTKGQAVGFIATVPVVPAAVSALYNPDYELIAVFSGDDAERNANEYFRNFCSEFCMRREYTSLAEVKLSIADECE